MYDTDDRDQHLEHTSKLQMGCFMFIVLILLAGVAFLGLIGAR